MAVRKPLVAVSGAIQELPTGDTVFGTAGTTANTFTAAQVIQMATAATSLDGLSLITTTPATVGAQKLSPRIRWLASGWKTTATAGAQNVEWWAEVLPVQGATNPASRLSFWQSINGSAAVEIVRFDSVGNMLIDQGGNGFGYCLGATTASTGMFATNGGVGFKGQGGVFGLASRGGTSGRDWAVGSGAYLGFTGSSDASAAVNTALRLDSTGVIASTNGTAGTYMDLKARNVILTNVLNVAVFLVSTLPSASTSGNGGRAHAADGLAPTFMATVVGGGTLSTPVYSDATNWKVG